MNRKILVAAGIGDNIWMMQKLINAGEQFDFVLAGDQPRRGKQIFDLLPQLCAHSAYDNSFGSADALKRNIVGDPAKTWYWKDIKPEAFYLACNWHLERGRRLEEWLPDLPITWKMPWQTEQFRNTTFSLLPQDGSLYIGIYMTSYSVLRHWNFWKEQEWLQLMERLYKIEPRCKFVLLGADFDIDHARNVIALCNQRGIPHVPVIGKELGLVIEVMKRLNYFFSFPSGLSVVATTVNLPVMMFYPKHLEHMMNSWAHPDKIESGEYKGCQFCTVDQALDWALNTYKIFNR